VEHDIFSHSLTTSQGKVMFIFLKAKGEAFEKFKQYKALVENEIGHKIKVLRSDNEGEFVSKKFNAFLAKCGI
jgi:hypothetical protein